MFMLNSPNGWKVRRKGEAKRRAYWNFALHAMPP
jgi:hypothetical protein